MDEFQFEIIKAHINSLTSINELKKQQQLYHLSDSDKRLIHHMPYILTHLTNADITYYDKLYELTTERLFELTKSLPKSPFTANTKPPNRR